MSGKKLRDISSSSISSSSRLAHAIEKSRNLEVFIENKKYIAKSCAALCLAKVQISAFERRKKCACNEWLLNEAPFVEPTWTFDLCWDRKFASACHWFWFWNVQWAAKVRKRKERQWKREKGTDLRKRKREWESMKRGKERYKDAFQTDRGEIKKKRVVKSKREWQLYVGNKHKGRHGTYRNDCSPNAQLAEDKIHTVKKLAKSKYVSP